MSFECCAKQRADNLKPQKRKEAAVMMESNSGVMAMTVAVDVSSGAYEISQHLLSPLMCVAVAIRGRRDQGEQDDHSSEPSARDLVGSIPHMVAAISAFLDYGCEPFWTIPKACERNSMRLLPRLASREPDDMNTHYRAYLFTKGLVRAVKNDNMEMIRWLCCEYCPTGFVWNAVEEAVALGKTRILEWLATRYDYVFSNSRLMDVAATNGHLETLQWLHARVPNPPGCSHMAMKHLIGNGHLAVLKWLLEQYPERTHQRFLEPPPEIDEFAPSDIMTSLMEPFDCSDVISDAPYSASFELFKWVHEHFVGDDFGSSHNSTSPSSRIRESCRNSGFDTIVRSAITLDTSRGDGEMKSVLWLHERYPERWLVNAMDFAATCGNLRIVKWLYKTRNESCTRQALCGAAKNGHLHVVEWLHNIEWLQENLQERNITQAIRMASKNGHLHLLKWFHEHDFSGFDVGTMDEAAMSGHLEIVKWLHAMRLEGCTTRAMDSAAGNNHLEVVKWLHINRSEGCSTEAMNSSARRNHLEMVKWLHENRFEGCTARAMDGAAVSNHLSMVKWLHSNRSEGCTAAAMDSASSYEMVKWLHENRTEGYTSALMYGAASNGDFELVKFVLALVGSSYIRTISSNALMHRHFEILQWLYEMNPAQVDLDRIRNRGDARNDGAMAALLVHM